MKATYGLDEDFLTVMYELVRHSPLFVEHGANYSVYTNVRSPAKKRLRTSPEATIM